MFPPPEQYASFAESSYASVDAFADEFGVELSPAAREVVVAIMVSAAVETNPEETDFAPSFFSPVAESESDSERLYAAVTSVVRDEIREIAHETDAVTGIGLFRVLLARGQKLTDRLPCPY